VRTRVEFRGALSGQQLDGNDARDQRNLHAIADHDSAVSAGTDSPVTVRTQPWDELPLKRLIVSQATVALIVCSAGRSHSSVRTAAADVEAAKLKTRAGRTVHSAPASKEANR